MVLLAARGELTITSHFVVGDDFRMESPLQVNEFARIHFGVRQ